MQFNSYLFIFIFLPLFLLVYFLSNKLSMTFGKIVVIAASIIFYSFGRVDMLIFLGVSIIINYGSAQLIRKYTKFYGFVFILPIIVNISLLLYFKYYIFFIRNVNRVVEMDIAYRDVILPLGISFYTFQQIAYIVSVKEGRIKSNSLIDYLCYILFFPKLLMGPLMEPDDFFEQINDEKRKNLNIDNLASGIKIFSLGLFKKAFIADTFSKAVTEALSIVRDPGMTATAIDCILLILFYSFEIYFDFSGYSDMAVGISSMINIDLPINFDSPYKALSIRDFWKRWHISLTKFLTEYIYIPLGGSRKGKVLTYINTMIVFLISGLWHGAGWVFIVWGGAHGVLCCLDRMFDRFEKKVFLPLRWLITFSLVSVLWLLFCADSIREFKEIMLTILTMKGFSISDGIKSSFNIPEIGFLFKVFHIGGGKIRHGVYMVMFSAFSFLICLIPGNNYKNKDVLNKASLIIASVCFILGGYSLSAEAVFVYYGF